MTFVYDKLSDTVVIPEGESAPSPAYWNYPYYRSSSGKYIGGNDTLDTSWVADTSNPPSLLWAADLSGVIVNDFFGIARTGFDAHALDDEGSLWGRLLLAKGVAEVPADNQTPVQRYNWDDASDPDSEDIVRIWAYTLPNNSIFILMLPKGGDASSTTAHRYYTAIKGNAAITTNTSTGWRPVTSFQDDNGDVWLAGIPDADPLDTMTLTRITDVTSGIGHASPQEFAIPTSVTPGCFPVGLYADGAFIGAIHRTSGFSDTLFRAELDDTGDITTLDVSANPVSIAWPNRDYAMQNAPDPANIFVLRENDDSRVITKMLPDLTFTDTYNLDDWNAGEHATEAAPETVFYPLYCEHRLAFYGTRYQYTDPPDNLNVQADLFIYYFGDGATDDEIALRVWGYSLDGHDHYVLRVGTSITLNFDLTTNSWAHWASPEVETWRAHVGQNWAGMGPDTLALGFGTDVVAGDDTTGQLWILDPTAGMDDDPTTGTPTAFDRKVTGEISMSGRNVLAVGAVTLDLSIGNPTETGSTITLRTSDDGAHNWATHDVITVTATNYSAVVEWRGLGQIKAPGRIFEFVDNGAAVRISAANLR